MLVRIGDGVWGVEAPLTLLGLRIGTRMMVARLSDGGLLLYSPVPLSPELRSAVDALGPVRHIVAPNLYHHLFAGDAKAAYPKAALHAPRGLERKRRDLAVDALLADEPVELDADLAHCPVRGSMLGEHVFLHRPSRTLICCDLIENFKDHDHWFTRTYLKLGGIHGQPGLSRPLRLAYRDRAAARASLDEILTWQPERIALCHGQPISADGAAILRQSYAWLKN